MKNISLTILALVLSAGVMAGCTEKKQPAQKAKEAASQPAESKPVEVKEAAPAVEAKEKAVEKKEEAPVAEAKARIKPAAVGAGVETGAAIFKSKCSPCHGAAGLGTAMAPAFKGNDWVRGAAGNEVANVIRNGRQGPAKRYKDFVIGMPANKEMPDSDVNALVEYIKSIN